MKAVTSQGTADHRRQLKQIADSMEDNLQGAERELRGLLEKRPDDIPARLLLTRLCFRRSGFEEMKEEAEAALALKPDQAQAMSMLALSLFYLGRTEEAAEAFRRQIAIKADQGGLTRLAWCQHRLGDLEGALGEPWQGPRADQARAIALAGRVAFSV